MTANSIGQIKKSRLLAHPLSGRSGLLREIGASQDHGVVFDTWARSLRPRTLLPSRALFLFSKFTTFIHDEDTQNIVAAMGGNEQGTDTWGSIIRLDKIPTYHTYIPQREEFCPIVTSMSFSPSRMMLVTTRYELLQPSLYPTDLAEILFKNLHQPSPFSQTLFANKKATYWASAANPCGKDCTFAIAASNGSFTLREEDGRWNLERTPNVQGQGEAVAVDWLGSNVVLKGCGRGAVRLWDLRSRGESTEPRIQHRTAINHVRSIDDNIIAVAGLQNELCTYDLRYTKRAIWNGPTQYYDRFSTYRNTMLDHTSTGMDVHCNLVAATTDDQRVQIFDVKRSVELRSRIKGLPENAACVKFVDEKWSGNGLKLMVASGENINSWAFESSEELNPDDIDEVHYCTRRWD